MLPIDKKTGVIEFHALVRQLEAKHGFDFHDMAQIHKNQKQFCRDRGIDHTQWYNKQFTKMNALELEVKALSDAITYQNVWHWLTDNDFEDVEHGAGNYIDLSEARLAGELPDYVLRFLRILRNELNAEGVTDDKVEFHVNW
jgi:hypothetical protein